MSKIGESVKGPFSAVYMKPTTQLRISDFLRTWPYANDKFAESRRFENDAHLSTSPTQKNFHANPTALPKDIPSATADPRNGARVLFRTFSIEAPIFFREIVLCNCRPMVALDGFDRRGLEALEKAKPSSSVLFFFHEFHSFNLKASHSGPTANLAKTAISQWNYERQIKSTDESDGLRLNWWKTVHWSKTEEGQPTEHAHIYLYTHKHKPRIQTCII